MSNIAIFVPHAGCPQCCSFCNQHVIAGQQHRVCAADVTAALERALQNPHHRDNQIAFFGGSFTAMDRAYMRELLEATVPYREAFAGIRLSTRPDAIDREVLSFLKPYGVAAIELGAQSMDDSVLALNRRGHTAADVVRAAALIKEAGVELGLQMMTGLYGDTDEKAIATAKGIAALQPATVRIYPTVVLEGTELDRLYKSGQYTPQSVEQAVKLCVKLMRIFEEANIRIIRVGLHASEELSGKRTAGAYHPAFKELCLAQMYYENALALLRELPQGRYTLAVGSRYLSQMAGQKKENIRKLLQAGYAVKIVPEAALEAYEVKIVREQD
ncbi:MAG: radical SAM protein [Ruminococcaceae bacterium]|nr:radical SAM protein [Oscillospiraceae bacterium]